MLGTELIGWFAEVLGKRPDGVQVQPDRGRRIMPDLEVLQHPLSKWCHSKNSFRCDHITNRLPAEPSTPWNVRDSALHLPEGLCSMVLNESPHNRSCGRCGTSTILGTPLRAFPPSEFRIRFHRPPVRRASHQDRSELLLPFAIVAK